MPVQQRPIDRPDAFAESALPVGPVAPAQAPEPEVRRAEPVGPVGTQPAAAASVLDFWAGDRAGPQQAPAAQAPIAAPVQAPVATPVQAPVAAPDQAAQPAQPVRPGQEEEPARLDRHAVTRSLGQGSKGDQVAAMQRFLGFDEEGADGKYGSGTANKVKEWQAAHGLPQTGRVDTRTLAAMRGDQHIFGYSNNHDPEKFVPKYAMTAYHESNDMRTAADPYATGCITNPDRGDDPGGKTYGTYQFESYTYADGDAGKSKVDGSTVSRFARWKNNPYGKELQAVVAEHGVGSAEFDKIWKKLSAEHNREFGAAQETFLEVDKADKVKSLFDKMGASEEARKDPRLFDLMIGSANQLDSLTDGVAKSVGAQQKKHGQPFTADEIGRAVIDEKIASVDGFFKSSSSETRDGVRARFRDERSVFPEKKPEQQHASS